MILGVDIGTQSLKAVAVGDRLEVRGAAAVRYGLSLPRPGWAEQAPALWEEALAAAVAGALSEAGAQPEEVRAVGLAGQLDGCLAVDARGRALGPCLIWMDRRAAAEAELLPADLVRRRCGLVADASHMAAKIAWLRRQGGGTASAVMFHQPVSYLVSRLAGRHVIDHAVASTTMLYSLEARGWDEELLRYCGLEATLLPTIAEADSSAGPLSRQGALLSGLPAGIPVATGTGDDFAAPLGAGLVEAGRLACVIGTAEVVGALDPNLRIDEAGLVETHAYPASGFFIENPGWLSGGVLSWLIATLRLKDVEELDALAATAPAGSDGLLFLPAMTGAMAPVWNAAARGCFYGLTPAHHAGHIARAVLEGCAFAMRDVLERLREMGLQIKAIRLLGGGSKSRLWARIRSDVAGLPVELPLVRDTAPLGAAMLGAVACGLKQDLAACAALVGGVAEVLQPDARSGSLYERAYGRYRRLFDSLRPLFEMDGQAVTEGSESRGP